MAGLSRDVVLNFIGRFNQLERESRRAGQQLDGLNRKFDGLIGGARKFAAVAGVAFGARELTQFVGSAIRSASDLEESMNAVSVVFGEAATKITDFSGDTEDAVFVAQSELNQLATNTGALLTGVGLSMDEAADRTINLANRAADMASVFNTDVPDAVGAINAALRGESEPIRRYNVLLDEASVKAKALELGLVGVGDEVGQQERVLARYALIMEQTAKFQGDAANTSDSLANQMRHLNEVWEKAKVAIGEKLVPVLVDHAIPALIDFVDWLSRAADIADDVWHPFHRLGLAVAELGGYYRDVSDIVAESDEGWRALNQILVEQGYGWREATTAAEDFNEQQSYYQAAAVATSTILDEGIGPLERWEQSFINQAQAGRDAAEATEDLAEAVEDAALSFEELANPAFRAFRAQERYNEALETALEDGKLTAAEARNVGEAWLSASTAAAEVGEQNFDAMLDSIRFGLDLTQQEAEALAGTFDMFMGDRIVNWDINARARDAETQRWIRAAEFFANNPTVTVNVRATGDTDVVEQLTRAQRRGAL